MKKDKHIHMVMNSKDYEKLQNEAKKIGCSVSALIRKRAIGKY